MRPPLFVTNSGPGIQPVLDVFTKYRDQKTDLADACLLHLADRENIKTILTLDQRHFTVLRKLDDLALTILPEIS